MLIHLIDKANQFNIDLLNVPIAIYSQGIINNDLSLVLGIYC
jgi:hypothetical protein